MSRFDITPQVPSHHITLVNVPCAARVPFAVSYGVFIVTVLTDERRKDYITVQLQPSISHRQGCQANP